MNKVLNFSMFLAFSVITHPTMHASVEEPKQEIIEEFEYPTEWRTLPTSLVTLFKENEDVIARILEIRSPQEEQEYIESRLGLVEKTLGMATTFQETQEFNAESLGVKIIVKQFVRDQTVLVGQLEKKLTQQAEDR